MVNSTGRFPLILLGIYAVLFLALSFNPVDRATWFAENLTVWVIVAVLVGLYVGGVRFTDTAYAFASVLIFLHTIGGHFTFALVPFELVTDTFGFERNHFDRVAHFTVGFYAFIIAEWLCAGRLVRNRFLLFSYPVFAIAAVAAGYEIIEWLYAAGASVEAGVSYLGSQGDIWDAQKDMLADIFGAVVATGAYFVLRTPHPERPKTAKDRCLRVPAIDVTD